MFAGRSAVCSQANKREDHSSFSKSGIRFLLFKQTKSQHSPFFLSFFQSRAPILIQCNAGRKEHLYRSQPERFARQQNRRDVFPCPLQVRFSQQSQNQLKQGWYQIKLENLPSQLYKQNVQIECSCFTTRVGSMSRINIRVRVAKS